MPEATVGEILLNTLRSSQPPHTENTYDEVLREISARVAAQGSVGKADIAAIVVWKRSNASSPWSRKLMEMPDAEVRNVTAKAYSLANDESMSIPAAGGQARQELRRIPGLGGKGAIASAVLLAASPSRMAVWDRRASTSLAAIGMVPKSGRDHYKRYLEIAVKLTDSMQDACGSSRTVIPREVDLALFHAAKNPAILDQLRRAAG
jgi:hypothetical protein